MAADEAAVADYFRTVAAPIDIPIMIQDAPLSSTRLAAGQLAELARDAAAARPAAQTGARAGVGVLRWTVVVILTEAGRGAAEVAERILSEVPAELRALDPSQLAQLTSILGRLGSSAAAVGG